MLSGTVRDVIDGLREFSETELEMLRTAVNAELQERDLSQKRTESAAEGLGTPGGQFTQAPARKVKMRPNGWGVKDGWDWVTLQVTCGLCRGTGWRVTLLDGERYPCQQCDTRGVLTLTLPVLRCPECGGPADERVMTGMKCGRCAYGGR